MHDNCISLLPHCSSQLVNEVRNNSCDQQPRRYSCSTGVDQGRHLRLLAWKECVKAVLQNIVLRMQRERIVSVKPETEVPFLDWATVQFESICLLTSLSHHTALSHHTVDFGALTNARSTFCNVVLLSSTCQAQQQKLH